ncbi:hypothetical protein SA19142_20720 [Staphylococcus argenteus]|nr:hypothetical protein SA19023_20830 [Staphylococcus argenteus]GJF45119.1 hypothetical protein SA19061_22090 [Staphylococcus argenteus]GJF55488.1 hypothetical protein SA19088_22310 [Staphylococcus argenteus]GJF60467.1 hypothetical protein SA19105_19550 [Staphylococcus argenteus]GJF70872.1 hypothetical protein SA19142_20720 [Staphylococcus argenteus]
MFFHEKICREKDYKNHVKSLELDTQKCYNHMYVKKGVSENV